MPASDGGGATQAAVRFNDAHARLMRDATFQFSFDPRAKHGFDSASITTASGIRPSCTPLSCLRCPKTLSAP